MNQIKSILILLFLISSFSLYSQDKYELSPLLNGIGMNTIFSKMSNYSTKSQKKNGNTLTYHRIKDGQLTFLGNNVTNAAVSTKNNLVEFISFIIEKKEIETPHFSIENFNKMEIENNISEENTQKYRRKIILQYINDNSTITQKTRQYLNQNYEFVSEKKDCEFDCFSEWKSDFSKIFIEKNNYVNGNGKQTKVYIEQSIIIHSTITN